MGCSLGKMGKGPREEVHDNNGLHVVSAGVLEFPRAAPEVLLRRYLS